MTTRTEKLRDMLMAYRAGSHRVYPEIEGQIRPLINYVLRMRFRNDLADQHIEDIIDDTMPIIEQMIRKFKFECPRCRKRFETDAELKAHGSEVHGVSDLKPSKRIEQVVKFKAKYYAYGQAVRFLRVERQRRVPVRDGVAIPMDELGHVPAIDFETRIDLQRIFSEWDMTAEDLLTHNVKPSRRYKMYADARERLGKLEL